MKVKTLSIRGLSIQQRFSLLIFALVLSITVIFTWLAYVGVRNAGVKIGQERLVSLSNRLSTMFGQSIQTVVAGAQAAAAKEPVKQYLISGGTEKRAEALAVLQSSVQERMAIYTALIDTNNTVLLHANKDSVLYNINFDSLWKSGSFTKNINLAGNMILLKDSMYSPVVIPVHHNKQLKGYLVKWRIQYATAQAIETFSQLLGTDANLVIGNSDGSFWTDLATPVAKPLVDTLEGKAFFTYRNRQNKKVMAAIKPIPNSSWSVVIEYSQKKMTEASSQFLNWIILPGILLIIAGLVITWLISRSITKPLKKLTNASSAIAGGNYAVAVEANRKDELGTLARSFNRMVIQVQNSHKTLEKKVQERTVQLETANKELESFSYSVSHDLRAPLRAVNGYAEILKEDYVGKMDDEANRLADKIISNSKRMGKLIDDLITFSQTSAKEMSRGIVNMNELVRSCIAEALQHEKPGKYDLHINDLPTTYGDENLLKQVWMNMISNAVKYSSKAASPRIEIGTVEGSPGMNTYFISDNGVGFSMQYADKLFGVFQRLHSSKEFEGEGIGLAFVKRIIKKHGGEIWAEAESGKGAKFYFSLPKSI